MGQRPGEIPKCQPGFLESLIPRGPVLSISLAGLRQAPHLSGPASAGGHGQTQCRPSFPWTIRACGAGLQMEECFPLRRTVSSVSGTRNRRLYQFKVTLRDVSPKIWRRVQVWENYTLEQLHRVLQAAMGWENYHLYEFRVGGAAYRDPDPENEPEILNAK